MVEAAGSGGSTGGAEIQPKYSRTGDLEVSESIWPAEHAVLIRLHLTLQGSASSTRSPSRTPTASHTPPPRAWPGSPRPTPTATHGRLATLSGQADGRTPSQ